MNDSCPASHRLSSASTVFFQFTYDAAIVLLYHVCLVYCCALCNSIYREFYSESVCLPSGLKFQTSTGDISSLGIRVRKGAIIYDQCGRDIANMMLWYNRMLVCRKCRK